MADSVCESGLGSNATVTLPVFPLPSLVLFPQVLQAFYIFEPRYRTMVKDLPRWGNMFAVALLKDGWEEEYENCPPFHSVICLCRLIKSQRRTDGTYDLLVAGTSRAQVLSESNESTPYRVITAKPLSETGVVNGAALQGHLGRKLLSCCDRRLTLSSSGASPIGEWMRKSLPLHVLTDLLAYSLPLDARCKQQLLADHDARRRAQRLIALMETAGSDANLDELVGASGGPICFN